MANRTRYTANLVSANNLYVDISTDKVGIGTTTPTSKLTVVGDVLVSGILTASHIVGTSLSISGISTLGSVEISSGIVTAKAGTGIVTYYGDGSKLLYVVASSSAVAIATNTTNQSQFLTYVTETGNVSGLGVTTTGLVFNPSTNSLGIGTITPTSKLDVRGDVSIASTLGIGTVIDIVPYDTLNSGTLSWEGSAGQLFSITNNLTTGSIYSVNDVSGIPSIDVDANGTIQLGPYGGNIGLGTTNPTAKLTVIGDVRVSGVSTFVGLVELDSSLRDINGAVGAAGSVLISTGAGVSWSTSASVSIANTTTSDIHYVGFSPVSTGTLTTLNVNTDRLQFNPSSGTLSATVFTSLSDRTQKEDIRPIENAIEIVNQLTGVRYNWKNNTNKPSIGLIAQDVEEVIPEVVVEMADGLKSVSYGNIVAVLIEAIKEQQVRIEELEDRLNA
jgi:hypothetical protein